MQPTPTSMTRIFLVDVILWQMCRERVRDKRVSKVFNGKRWTKRLLYTYIVQQKKGNKTSLKDLSDCSLSINNSFMNAPITRCDAHGSCLSTRLASNFLGKRERKKKNWKQSASFLFRAFFSFRHRQIPQGKKKGDRGKKEDRHFSSPTFWSMSCSALD